MRLVDLRYWSSKLLFAALKIQQTRIKLPMKKVNETSSFEFTISHTYITNPVDSISIN